VLLAAVWPRFRRWAGWMPLALSVGAVVLTPLSTESGEALEHRVEHSDLIETHSQLAEGLLPWVIGLAVAAALLLVVARRERQSATTPPADGSPAARADEAHAGTSVVPRPVLLAGAVLGLVAALGTTVQVVRIGHSGAQAAWSDSVSQTPAPSGGDDNGN